MKERASTMVAALEAAEGHLVDEEVDGVENGGWG